MNYGELIKNIEKIQVAEFEKKFLINYVQYHKMNQIHFKNYDFKVLEFGDVHIAKVLGDEFDLFWPVLEIIKTKPLKVIEIIMNLIKISKSLKMNELNKIMCIFLARASRDLSPEVLIKVIKKD